MPALCCHKCKCRPARQGRCQQAASRAPHPLPAPADSRAPPACRRVIQLLGLLLGVIGLALGFKISGGWDGLFHTHRNLGIATTVLGLAQLAALPSRFRPKPWSPRRRLWNQAHW